MKLSLEYPKNWTLTANMYDLSVEGASIGPYNTILNETFYISTIFSVSTLPIRNISLISLIDSDIDWNTRYGYYYGLKISQEDDFILNNKTTYKIVYIISNSEMPYESKTMKLYTVHEDKFYILKFFASADIYKNYGAIFKNLLNSITFK
jgi:hypothetical protein